MTGDIRPIVEDAVARFGVEDLFTVGTFADALTAAFETRRPRDAGWHRDVLRQLPYVSPQPAGFWRYEEPR